MATTSQVRINVVNRLQVIDWTSTAPDLPPGLCVAEAKEADINVRREGRE